MTEMMRKSWQWKQPDEEKPAKGVEVNIIDQDGCQVISTGGRETRPLHAGDQEERYMRSGRRQGGRSLVFRMAWEQLTR